MKKIYLLPFLLVIILFISCGKIEEPHFRRIGNFRVNQLGIQGTTVGFDVTFYNPNNFGVNVKEAECDIYIDSVYAGKFTQAQGIDVPKQSEFSLPLIGNIPLQTALKLDISKLVNRDILFRADGSVKLGKAGVYITRPFNYKGSHKIQM